MSSEGTKNPRQGVKLMKNSENVDIYCEVESNLLGKKENENTPTDKGTKNKIEKLRQEIKDLESNSSANNSSENQKALADKRKILKELEKGENNTDNSNKSDDSNLAIYLSLGGVVILLIDKPEIIINNDNPDEAFFCFERTVKEGWNDLISNYENIKEVEIEFEEKEANFKTYRKAMNIFSATLKALKFLLKLLANLVGSKRKSQKSELEQKQLKHVRNFTPTHYSWQQRARKKLTKKQQEYYQKEQKRKQAPIKPN
ncbi:894_t:CDS:2 [Ambispora gerdemannii]|uniref:894_t:CDS:1 n=1 Tax=Ambispora gerdemannii TaxID=144530 RepID=A0A9N9FZZ3_9GLOM|nr:894_t:CDS:2 [Ambispora gerdemannii]